MEERYGEIDLNNYSFGNRPNIKSSLTYNFIFKNIIKLPDNRYLISDFSKGKWIDNFGDTYDFEFKIIDNEFKIVSLLYNEKLFILDKNFVGIPFDITNNIKLTKCYIDKIKKNGFSKKLIEEAKEFSSLYYKSKSQKEKKYEIQNKEIVELKENMISLIQSMNSIKEYCMKIHSIVDDHQKIIEEVCKENIEIKKHLQL